MAIKFGSDMCERHPLVSSIQNCSHLVNVIDRRIAPEFSPELICEHFESAELSLGSLFVTDFLVLYSQYYIMIRQTIIACAF